MGRERAGQGDYHLFFLALEVARLLFVLFDAYNETGVKFLTSVLV